MFKKSPLKSSKLLKKKRRILFLKVGVTIFSMAVLITGLSLLSHLGFFTITTVSVKGNSAVETERVQEMTKMHLSGKYYWLFSRSNRFLYPKKTIQADILNQFKRVKEISLDVDRNDLVISIVERTPAYTWCSGMPAVHTQSKCYFIDSEGYIFSESPTFSGNAFFAFYGEVNNENPIGSTYLNAQVFKSIDGLIDFLNTHKLHPYAFLSHDNGVYDLYLEQGGKIIFKEGQDISILISDIDLIIKNTELFSKKNTSRFEYVDLRFGNKLYYKLSGDNALEIPN